MRIYPLSTSNKNVPKDSFLIAEVSQMSGEIITTYYANRDGELFQVKDWKDCKPYPAYPFEVCRLTCDPVSIIYSKISGHFKRSFIDLMQKNVLR